MKRLESWVYYKRTNVIHGDIYGDDSPAKMKDGLRVCTQDVAGGQDLIEGNVVKTENTEYLLGKPKDASNR